MRAAARPASRRWTDLPLRAKGLVVVALPVAALIVSAVLLLLLQLQTREANRWVEHTYEVRGEIRQTLQLLVDAESGVRGYALSGQENFLEPYRQSGAQLPASLDHLEQLIGDNPAQLARLQRVRALIVREQADLAAFQAATATGGDSTPVTHAALLGQNKSDMDTLRQELLAMQGEEDRLLATRQAQERQIHAWSLTAITASGALGLLGGLLAASLFTAGIGGRVQRLEENAVRLARREPLLPLPPARDEIGRLGQRLSDADTLLAMREAAVRESEARFRSAYDHAPLGMALIGLDGGWLQVNPALCALLGYSEAELLATTPRALAHPDDRERGNHYGRELLAGERDSYQIETRYLHREGRSILALLSTSLVRDDRGEPTYFIAQLQDITERTRTEEALREAAESFDSLFSASEAIAITEGGAGRCGQPSLHGIARLGTRGDRRPTSAGGGPARGSSPRHRSYGRQRRVPLHDHPTAQGRHDDRHRGGRAGDPLSWPVGAAGDAARRDRAGARRGGAPGERGALPQRLRVRRDRQGAGGVGRALAAREPRALHPPRLRDRRAAGNRLPVAHRAR